MKLLFQGLSYTALGLILSVSAGCGSEPVGEESFTDEELFEAVMFLQGPAVASLPESVVSLSKTRIRLDGPTSGYNEFVQSIVDEVAVNYPAFLAEFGAAVRSGDERVVEDEFDDMISVLTDLYLGEYHTRSYNRLGRSLLECKVQEFVFDDGSVIVIPGPNSPLCDPCFTLEPHLGPPLGCNPDD